MEALFDLLDRRNDLACRIPGFELASDRGNLSPAEEDELEGMKRSLDDLEQRAAALWGAAAAETPDLVRAYDGIVDRLLAGHLVHASTTFLANVRARAAPTRSPERAFDSWVVWGVLRIGRDCGE